MQTQLASRLILVGAPESRDYRNVDSEGLMKLKQDKDSPGNFIRGHLCYIVTRNLPTLLHPCPESSSEAEFGINDHQLLGVQSQTNG